MRNTMRRLEAIYKTRKYMMNNKNYSISPRDLLLCLECRESGDPMEQELVHTMRQTAGHAVVERFLLSKLYI